MPLREKIVKGTLDESASSEFRPASVNELGRSLWAKRGPWDALGAKGPRPEKVQTNARGTEKSFLQGKFS